MKKLFRRATTEPCPFCGSTTPRTCVPGTDTCVDERGCEARRCKWRKKEDDERATRDGVREQCHATRGQKSVKFCTLCRSVLQQIGASAEEIAAWVPVSKEMR